MLCVRKEQRAWNEHDSDGCLPPPGKMELSSVLGRLVTSRDGSMPIVIFYSQALVTTVSVTTAGEHEAGCVPNRRGRSSKAWLLCHLVQGSAWDVTS